MLGAVALKLTSHGGKIYLVEDEQDVANLVVNDPAALAFVTQTTLSMDDTAEIIDALRTRFPKTSKSSVRADAAARRTTIPERPLVPCRQAQSLSSVSAQEACPAVSLCHRVAGTGQGKSRSTVCCASRRAGPRMADALFWPKLIRRLAMSSSLLASFG